jgi:hypothetical protein
MRRVVVVSNRVSLPEKKSGQAGGLATAVAPLLQAEGGLWFGWSGKVHEEAEDQSLGFTQAGRVRYAHPAASGPNAVTYWTDHLFWREGAPLIDRPPRPPPPASWPARLAAARARLIAALTPPPTHLTKDLLAASGLLSPARLFEENGG